MISLTRAFSHLVNKSCTKLLLHGELYTWGFSYPPWESIMSAMISLTRPSLIGQDLLCLAYTWGFSYPPWESIMSAMISLTRTFSRLVNKSCTKLLLVKCTPEVSHTLHGSPSCQLWFPWLGLLSLVRTCWAWLWLVNSIPEVSRTLHGSPSCHLWSPWQGPFLIRTIKVVLNSCWLTVYLRFLIPSMGVHHVSYDLLD